MLEVGRMGGLASVLAVVAFVGCGDDSAPVGGGGGNGSGGEPGSGGSGGEPSQGGAGGAQAGLDIEWHDCPVNSNQMNGDGAECAAIKVPLDWSNPDGEKIDFFVKRLLAENQPSRGQLWLLNGGPGYSGADFEGLFQAGTIDIYLPDHRGVGRSSRLSCPDGESDLSEAGYVVVDEEMPACLDALEREWGDRLDHFTLSNAARDVGEVIRATKLPDDDIVIYGGSYGTVWANRLMVLYPGEQGAVVLDAVANDANLDRMDVWLNDLGKNWMDACGADTFCASKLGPDPWATMTTALDALDAGDCPGVSDLGIDRRTLQEWFTALFYQWQFRPLIAPMVYRLARCDASDVDAFQNLLPAFTTQEDPTVKDRFFSRMLSAHVALSELWTVPAPTAAEISAFRDTANVSHFVPTQLTTVQPGWPVYPLDAAFGLSGDTETPVLILHGQFDFIPQSVADAAAAHFTGPAQTLVTIPNAPHGTFQAPVVGGGPGCASQIFSQFIANPSDPLDTSCTEDVVPLDFEVDTTLSGAIFGTNDAYDGVP